jgi:hypothetical protein
MQYIPLVSSTRRHSLSMTRLRVLQERTMLTYGEFPGLHITLILAS